MELVTVIIPTKNRLPLLKRAIESVKKQTCTNIEIIIIDEASTDGTKEYLAALQQTDPFVKVVFNSKSLGAAQSRNLGIELAKGEFVAFIDDDDEWMPEKTRKQIDFLNHNSECVAVTSDFQIIHKKGKLGQRIKRIPVTIDKQTLLCYNFLGGASMCLAKTSSLKEINGFNPSLSSCQDWDLWLKLYSVGKIGVISEPLVRYYCQNEDRISSRLNNVYEGRRSIYFSYRDQMTENTAKRNLSGVFFIKILMRKGGFLSKMFRLRALFKYTSFRLFLSYIRLVFLSTENINLSNDSRLN